MKIPGLSFSWKRALGITKAKQKIVRATGIQTVPPFRSMEDLKVRLDMKSDSLQEAINHSTGFRMVNLASTVPSGDGEYVADRIAVEHYPQNTSYGCCINRGSRITINAPSNMIDPGLTHFCFYLAYIGQFNYISREIGAKAPYKSYYAFKSEDDVEGLREYNADFNNHSGMRTHEPCVPTLSPKYLTLMQHHGLNRHDDERVLKAKQEISFMMLG